MNVKQNLRFTIRNVEDRYREYNYNSNKITEVLSGVNFIDYYQMNFKINDMLSKFL